jgi:hypothetical protein
VHGFHEIEIAGIGQEFLDQILRRDVRRFSPEPLFLTGQQPLVIAGFDAPQMMVGIDDFHALRLSAQPLTVNRTDMAWIECRITQIAQLRSLFPL